MIHIRNGDTMDSYTNSIDENLKKLGEKIKSLREKKGYTKSKFIVEADIGKYYFYRIEYGNANPSLMQLKKIADVLNIKVRDLIDF